MVIADMFSISSKFYVNPLLAVYFPSSIHEAAFIPYGPTEVLEQTKSNGWSSVGSTRVEYQLPVMQAVRLLETQLKMSGNISQDIVQNPKACFKTRCKKPHRFWA